jgi:hypothetical protein
VSDEDEVATLLAQVVMFDSDAPPPPEELALNDAVLGHLSDRPARSTPASDPDVVEALRLSYAIAAALAELGAPTPDYPAPVANAVRILTEALLGGEPT